MSAGDHLVVAAIDFGTTFSGYAFSFRHKYAKDPTSCSTQNWYSGMGNFQSPKTSTCALFDPKGKFSSFGFEAEEKYSNLILSKKHNGWMYFRRFKMKLYNLSRGKNFPLEASNGKTMDALTVFSESIKYLKNHLLGKCKEQKTCIKDEDVQFVLTVPAIWTDPAKQFMRDAAEKAGIKREKLIMALEPEAASLFCKHSPMEKGDRGFESLKDGSKYIVLDAGGGTIDITVHQVEEEGNLKEIHKANGGDWGGTKVDEAFKALLADIVGNDVMDSFCETQMYDLLALFTSFEVKKRTITSTSTDQITFSVPVSLTEIYRKINKAEIQTAVDKRKKYEGKISWIGDKLRIDADIAKDLYRESICNIKRHLRILKLNPKVNDAEYILMVGGFSESPILQEAIRDTFPGKTIVIPRDAYLAVLKGAVTFGHQPNAIKYRVSKFTYGIRSSVPFDEGIHDVSKMYKKKSGEKMCGSIFSKHVEIDEEIKCGAPQSEQVYVVVEPDNTQCTVAIYTSIEKNPFYVTDRDCTEIGSFVFHVADKGPGRTVTAWMTFSDTELKVNVRDNQTQHKRTYFLQLE